MSNIWALKTSDLQTEEEVPENGLLFCCVVYVLARSDQLAFKEHECDHFRAESSSFHLDSFFKFRSSEV